MSHLSIFHLSLEIKDRRISMTSRCFIFCTICSCANETHLFIFLDQQVMRYWFAILVCNSIKSTRKHFNSREILLFHLSVFQSRQLRASIVQGVFIDLV